MFECSKNVYMVWVKDKNDSFPIEPFYLKKDADKRAKELNIKNNTDKYFVAPTNIGTGILI